MKLKDVAEVRLGYPFRGAVTEAANASVLAVQMKNASADSGVDWRSCIPVSLEGKKKPDWLEVGDILLATRGSSNYAVLVNVLPSAGLAAVATPQFYVLRVKQGTLQPEYLHWWLNQAPCRRYFERNAEGSFTKSLRRAVLEDAPIVIPSEQEQQTVIKLTAVLKAQNNALNEQLNNNQVMQKAIANDLTKKYQSLGDATA